MFSYEIAMDRAHRAYARGHYGSAAALASQALGQAMGTLRYASALVLHARCMRRVGEVSDITDLKETSERLRLMCQYDDATRRLYADVLCELALAYSLRRQQSPVEDDYGSALCAAREAVSVLSQAHDTVDWLRAYGVLGIVDLAGGYPELARRALGYAVWGLHDQSGPGVEELKLEFLKHYLPTIPLYVRLLYLSLRIPSEVRQTVRRAAWQFGLEVQPIGRF